MSRFPGSFRNLKWPRQTQTKLRDTYDDTLPFPLGIQSAAFRVNITHESDDLCAFIEVFQVAQEMNTLREPWYRWEGISTTLRYRLNASSFSCITANSLLFSFEGSSLRPLDAAILRIAHTFRMLPLTFLPSVVSSSRHRRL